MSKTHHQLIRDFFAALPTGSLPDELLAPDMSGWNTTQGVMDKAAYLACVKVLGAIFDPPIAFNVKSITAEEDRAVAEVDSRGTLVNGEEYRNNYVFVFRIRDGRIASVAEHFNPDAVREKMIPVLQSIIAKPSP
jgi:uncharacterized protein